jgi:hypothetical protein
LGPEVRHKDDINIAKDKVETELENILKQSKSLSHDEIELRLVPASHSTKEINFVVENLGLK